MSEATPERELPPALILAELERITSCAQFRRAGLLQRMLSHLVRTSLAGETSRLREFNLALDCFRRSASRFDPHSDSGVRVAANRIRQKLAAWYANEGADSGIRIDLPAGTYVPTFARQDPRHEPATATAVAVAVAAARGTGRRSHFPTTAEVRDLYDRARFSLRQQNPASSRKAIELFDRATHLDPRFAPAWSGLAMAWLGLVGWTIVPTLPDVESARRAASKALEIDPGLSEARVSLASIIYRYEFDFDQAAPLYRQAIALDPTSRYAHHGYAFALTMNGRFDEADAEFRVARELDPLDQSLRCQHALVRIYKGRYDIAEAELMAILEIDQSNVLAHSLLGATYLYSRQLTRATDEYQWLIENAPKFSIGYCGRAQVLAMMRLKKRALAALDEMVAMSEDGFVSPYQIAMVYARLKHEPRALEWLDRAAIHRDANFICAPVDPTFAELRASPGWAALMKTHGLGNAAVRLRDQPRSRGAPALTPP